MPHPERPTTFVQWRYLWHLHSKYLGWCVARHFDGRRVRMSKELYQKLRQVERINRRLELESVVMDETWCRELMRLFREHNNTEPPQ